MLIEGYRRMSSARKIARVRDLNWTLQQRWPSPSFGPAIPTTMSTPALRWAARLYDRETMIAAFGWDPDGHG